jgi:polar amino acid transport system substrate-binding protein
MQARYLLLLACTFAIQASAGESIVLEADDQYPPYSYMDNGQLKGIYVELIKRAASLLAPKYDVVLKPVPWKRGLRNLKSGRSLGLVGIYRINARTYISQYSEPFNRETMVIFCTAQVMNQSPRQFPADFAGLTLGINLGFALGDRMSDAVNSKVFKIRESKGNEANLLKLQAGEIDCYVNDRLAVYYSFNRLRNKQRQRQFNQYNDFRLNPAQELSHEDAMIGYSAAHASSAKHDFIQQMNSALAQLKQQGLIDELIAKSIDPGLPPRPD